MCGWAGEVGWGSGWRGSQHGSWKGPRVLFTVFYDGFIEIYLKGLECHLMQGSRGGWCAVGG
jgi:hypothetical protein